MGIERETAPGASAALAATTPGATVAAHRADPAAVYAYVGRFFAELAAAGVVHVVISPGSRSTPLAIAAERCPGLRTWIELDERAAAFFALGIGRASGRPAALVCTSGTAAANYLPAIVEAHHARVPLIALTADRPSELRDFGAGQTIEQPGLYGRHPRWAVEVPIAEPGLAALRHAEALAARAVAMASGRPAGPVHLNWPLREPLAPNGAAFAELDRIAASTMRGGSATSDGGRTPRLRFSSARLVADPADVEALVALATTQERGVVVCGPLDADEALASALGDFAARAGWPVFADPASPLRSGPWTRSAPILDAGDLLARSPGFAARMTPEVVIRIGDPPVSKAGRLWLEAARPAEVWWLDEGGQWGEPSQQATRVVRGGAASLLAAVASRLSPSLAASRGFGRTIVEAAVRGRSALFAASGAESGAPLSGLVVAEAVARRVPDGGPLFASNSMAIRLLDLAMANRAAPRRVFCNRGASGIDGVTSTALGVAAATGRTTLLLTGDLAFLHDLPGLLLARREAIPLAVVVLDDGGGGIFRFLPIAGEGERVAFERLFQTPHGVDLAHAAALFGLDYFAVTSTAELERALDAALAARRVALVHVRVEAAANEAAFRAAVARGTSAVDAFVTSAVGGRSVFVEADGVRLHAWLDEPARVPTPEVLVLHGFTGAAESMESVARGLAPFARVARLDLVGHGRSDAPEDPKWYAMEACAAQIVHAASGLGFARPHLVGYSMGGRAALAAAVARPEAFASLVLVGATAGIADPVARAERVAADRALADSIERDGLERFVDAWMAQPLFASQARLGAEALDRARRQRLANRPHGLANSLRGMGAGAQAPLHEALAQLRLPVLLVVGSEDAKFRAIADELARRLSSARIAVLENAGHAAHLEAPDGFAQVVGEFFASLREERS